MAKIVDSPSKEGAALVETRRRVLDHTAELIQRRGYSAITMDEIAAGLGMSKRTLYQYFTSKEELAKAALEHVLAEAERELAALRDHPSQSFGERLRDHMLLVAQRYARIDTALLEDLERANPALFQRFGELSRQTIERQFGDLVAAGIQAGEFRADLDPRVVVRAVAVLSAQLVRPAMLGALGLSPLSAFQAITGLVLDGLRVRAKTPDQG